MNFSKYCVNRYQEIAVLIADKQEYDAHYDAESKAILSLLNGYKTFLKILFYPKALYNFFCVKIGLKDEPIPVLTNQAKERQKTEEQKKRSPDRTLVLDS